MKNLLMYTPVAFATVRSRIAYQRTSTARSDFMHVQRTGTHIVTDHNVQKRFLGKTNVTIDVPIVRQYGM